MNGTIGIYSKNCWIEEVLQEATIYIHDGVILEIKLGESVPSEANVIDYNTAIVMPGAIDAHVHINEPGRTEWEGFETATKAAARGGITTIVDMPLNSSPVVTTLSAFKDKLEASKHKLYANCGFWAGATMTSVEDVVALIEEGCLGVKVFLSHSGIDEFPNCLLYTSPSPRDQRGSRMPSSA